MPDRERLQVTTPGESDVVMTRVFDAPRELVFDAWTRPDLVRRWLGAFGGWTMEVCEIDLRPGGAYRFVMRNGDERMAWGGVYREVVRPERVISTEAFDEAWYPGECLITTTFEEEDGRTILSSTATYESAEARSVVMSFNAMDGVAASFDRLAEVLALEAAR